MTTIECMHCNKLMMVEVESVFKSLGTANILLPCDCPETKEKGAVFMAEGVIYRIDPAKKEVTIIVEADNPTSAPKLE